MTNKVKYIVTDPCYIIPKDIWRKICSNTLNNTPNQYERFNAAVAEALTEFSEHKAWAAGTGYGDWSNRLGCEKSDVILQPGFYADAGMVCVCRLTSKVEEAFGDIKSGGAIFEAGENIEVTFKGEDMGWTVVYIKDKENDIYISSTEASSEYDEDDYEDDYNDEDWY